jgi:hypothetical protein
MAEKDAELEAMKQAIFNAMYSWGALETELGSLMGCFFDDPSLGMSLYFTPQATEVRIRLLHTTFDHFEFNTNAQLLLECWKEVYKKLSRAKDMRNKIAHWQVVNCSIQGLPSKLRLIPPMSNMNVMRQQMRELKQAIAKTGKPPKPQYYGMSAHNIAESAKQFSELFRLVAALGNIVTGWRRYPNKPEAWLEKLLQLSNDLQIDPHPPYARTHQEPKPQRPSSPATPARGKPPDKRLSAKQRREVAETGCLQNLKE